MFGESVLSEAGFLKRGTWNEDDHPRDERGRFCSQRRRNRGARSLIKTALQGRKTADSAKELASILGTLSVKELHSLKQGFNISASGLKRELIGKIADRPIQGRRKDYSTEPENRTDSNYNSHEKNGRKRSSTQYRRTRQGRCSTSGGMTGRAESAVQHGRRGGR